MRVPPSPVDPARLGLGLLFQRARDAVVVGDALTGRIQLWNDAAVTLFGYTSDEARSLAIEALVPEALKEQHRIGLDRYAKTGRGLLIDSGKAVELPARRKDGAQIRVELTLSPIEGSEFAGRYVMAIIRDVTERAESQRELRDRTEALQRSEEGLRRALDELRAAHEEARHVTAIAAHELGNPLSAIVGLAAVLRNRWADTSEDDKRAVIEAIDRQANRLSRLADDLLTASRLDSGTLQPRIEALGVAHALREALRDAGDAGPAAVSVPGDLRVLADPQHLARILGNYLGNAVKYGAPPIALEARAVDGMVEIRVRDQGEGVPEDVVPRLFGRFVRGSTAAPGAGLGLSIVRGLAQANGGDAWFESNTPRGSTFCVRLPRAMDR